MARSPADISSVSRARNGARNVDGPTEIAARTSARAVIDFEPGRGTVAYSGPPAVGAVHGVIRGVRVLQSATRTVCNPDLPPSLPMVGGSAEPASAGAG